MASENAGVADASADEPVGMGCALQEFKERNEITELIGKVEHIYKDQIAVEMTTERFLCMYNHSAMARLGPLR